MSDENAERNQRLKATMADRNSTNLNKSGKEGQVVRSPDQRSVTKPQGSHRDPNRK